MGIENEVKFEVSPGNLEKLAAARSLRPANGQIAEHKYFVSTYFDTPKHFLRRNGVSLRVRQAGKKRVQTIKTARDGIALGRDEWESRIESNEPDFRAARGTALEPLLSKNIRRALDPIFTTHVHRTLVPLRPGNSLVELALDQGHVRVGRNATPLAEVELELKDGSVADLFSLLALGLLISTICSTQQQAFATNFFVVNPLFTLSGFSFPISSMPEVLQWLSYVNPLRYYLIVIRGTFLKGIGIAFLWPEFLAMAMIAAALLTISILRFRKSLE